MAQEVYDPKRFSSSVKKKRNFFGDTLDSLEDDEEYVSVAERFLTTIGESDTTVDDVYEYLRDEEWNLGSSAKRSLIDIPSFTPQQKEDYKYLRGRFEKADMGGFSQYLNFIADAGVDLATDPLTLAAVVAAPFTAGGSLALRGGAQGVSQLAKVGLKKVGKSIKQDKPLGVTIEKTKAYKKLPSGEIDWKATLRSSKDAQSKAVKQYYKDKVKNVAILGAAEGTVWGGIDEYLRQERDSIDGIDFRDGLNLYEIGSSALVGGVLAAGIGGGLTKLGQAVTKEARRNIQKFSDEGLVDEKNIGFQASKLKDSVISKTVGKPVTRFRTLAKSSKTLKELLPKFRYDVYKFGKEVDDEGKRIGAGKVGESYQEVLSDYNGKYIQQYEDILKPLMVRGKLSKDNEEVLTKLMRTRFRDRADKVPEATKLQLDVADKLRKLADNVIKDGRGVGIFRRTLKSGPNAWFPRRWKWSVVNQDRDELADIMVDSNAVTVNDATALRLIQEDRREDLQNLITVQNDFEAILEDFPKRTVEELRDYLERYKLTQEGSPEELKTVFQEQYEQILSNKRSLINQIPDSPQLKKEKLSVANEIIDDMLSKKEQVNQLDIETLGTVAPSSFSPRKLFLLDDFDIEKFIDDDFDELMRDYFSQSSRLYARSRMFGGNIQEFNERFVKNIESELKDSGVTLTNKDKDQLANLYNYTTGLADNSFFLQGSSDTLKIAQQLAHLPLATLSSLTEIFIPLTRVGAKPFIKGVAETIKLSAKRIGDNTLKELEDRHGLSKDEATREMHRVFLALDQAVAQRIDSLAGEGVQSVRGKKIQRNFFKLNLLSQWTQTVQLASFTMGKDLITRNLKDIAKLESEEVLSKATKKKISRLEQELLDLGIDVQAGLSWVKSGARIYDSNKNSKNVAGVRNWDNFYENQVMKGAARFTNEVILGPSKASSIRPHVQQTPVGTILFQFLGYPTAFSNTVLKNFYGQVTRNPIRGGAKVLSTGLIMTGAAAMTNYARNGFSFEKSDGTTQDTSEIMTEAVQRWGGFGYAEYLRNAQANAGIGGGFLGSTVKAVTGPAVADVIDAIAYRQGPGELIATNLPGYSLYRAFPGIDEEDRNFKQTVKRTGQDIDRFIGLKPEKKEKSLDAIYNRLEREYRIKNVEGGKISEDIPKTSDNPSSRIDKTTGISYEDQAGDILENRERFAVGSIILRKLGKKFFSSKDDEEDLFISPDELSLREEMHKEQSQIKDDVYLVDNDVDKYGLHVQVNRPLNDPLVKRGSLRTLQPFNYGGTLNSNEHFSRQVLNDDTFIKQVQDKNLKKELESLQKDYNNYNKYIPFIQVSPNQSDDVLTLYSSKLIDLFNKYGYDSIKYKEQQTPVDLEGLATEVTEFTKESEVLRKPYSVQASASVNSVFDELEDKYPDLKDQLEATGFKEEIPADVVPELPTKEQIAVKQMTFEGRNEPVYADALKETNQKYFLLDGTQFLEKNKYRNTDNQTLFDVNTQLSTQEKKDFLEERIILSSTPDNQIAAGIERGPYNLVTTAVPVVSRDNLRLKESLKEVDVIYTQHNKEAFAYYDRKENAVHIDPVRLRSKYEEKAWTKIRDDVKETKPDTEVLPENTFKTFEEWAEFIKRHEFAHANYE